MRCVDLDKLDALHKASPGRFLRCVKLAQKYINSRFESGKLLEIGAQHQQVSRYFPKLEYFTMDVRKTAENVIVGDITNCPEIESNCFDVVYLSLIHI